MSSRATATAAIVDFFPRLVIVEHGRIIADGPPAQVLTDERIRETFGVEPALVRLAAGVSGG